MKLRYFPCYHDEWLVGQTGLDNACRGLYLTACLLMYSHGGPVSIDELRRNCSDHGHAFNRQLRCLINAGKLVLNEGQIVNKRVINELQKRDKRSEDGEQNASKRWKNNGLDDEVALAPSNANQNQNQTLKEKEESKDSSKEKKEIGSGHHPHSQAKANGAGTRLLVDWQPDLEEREYAQRLGLNPDIVADTFRDYWIGKAGAAARKADWHATWRNWCRNEVARSQQAGSNRRSPYGPITQLYEGAHDAAQDYIARHRDPDSDPAEQPSRPLLDRK